MKKQFTRRQIQEAIAYWTAVLCEDNGTQLVKSLEKEFGRDLLFSKIRSFQPSQNDLSVLFSIINKHIFKNQLTEKPINLSQALSNDTTHGFACYTFTPKIIELNRPLNEFKSSQQFINELLASLKSPQHLMKVSVDDSIQDFYDIFTFGNGTFTIPFLASVLCHEMIHQADAYFGDLAVRYAVRHICKLIDGTDTYKYDPHTGYAFMIKMKEARENGLNVLATMPEQTFDDLNSNSTEYLIKSLNEALESIHDNSNCNKLAETDWTHLSKEEAQSRIDTLQADTGDECKLREFGYGKDGKFRMSFTVKVI